MKTGGLLPTARDAITMGGLMVLSLAAGFVGNRFRIHPLPLVYQVRPVRLDASDIDLKQLEAIVAAGKGIVLDARPELFHRLGHVPGALSLPREDFDAAYGRLQRRLEPFRTGVVVVYCADESCDDSRFVQSRLLGLGFEHVSVFPGGWDEWTGSGLPREGERP